MCSLRSCQLLDSKYGIPICKDILFLPFNFYPRWIPNNQVKPSSFLKQIRELEFPVHKLILFRNLSHKFQSRKQLAQVIDIHFALPWEEGVDLGYDFILLCREEA